MKCPACQTSNPSQARFCFHCGLFLIHKCSNCESDLVHGSRFCKHCGHPVIEITPADDSRLSRLTAVAPESLVEKVRAADNFTGERRVVTFLFVDVVGSTLISEQVSPEEWGEIMNQVVDQIIPVIYRYEGTVARVLGDSILVFFGAPIAHEDDPVRAVRSALEILPIGNSFSTRLHQEFGIDFAIRACIHSGSVIINSVKDGMKFEFTSIGGDVNLTSRIKFAANPMSVILTEGTYRFVNPIFDCVPQEPVVVKGRADPVQLFRVEGIKSQPGPIRGLRGLESKMIGRDRELQSLANLCEAVRAGLGRTVIIHGEPGLGKTRLISEWKNIVDSELLDKPPIWAEGRSLSYGHGLAYHLLTSMIRSILGIPLACDESDAKEIIIQRSKQLFGKSMVEVYPFIAHMLSIDIESDPELSAILSDPQTLKTQYYRAVRKLVIKISENKPLVLVLEDLHWADSSSVDLLIRLLPLVRTGSILMCLVLRDDRDSPGWRLVNAAREIMGGSLMEISLSPLTDDHSREMISNLLEIKEIPEKVRNSILRKAEGNPFFVEEVIRMLIDRGAIIRENDGWVVCDEFSEIEIPDNLQGLLLARIDRLPDDVKNVLRVASVIGRKFPVQVLQQVLLEGIE